MFRILTASKDTYITNKVISGRRVTDSNVGQAGTIDLFKLYNETKLSGSSGSIVELSRGLIQFDYSALQALTGSTLNFASGNFSAQINLKDVYGGQTTPSNFTLEIFPLSKSWDEGRGHDVIAFRDLDSANWLTASLTPLTTWSQAGASASGSLGEDVDIIVSGTLGTPVTVSLGASQTFDRGDEELLINVTQLVSASLAGLLPNNGFRISYTAAQEEDSITRFVKRFGATNAFNKNLHPRMIVKYNDAITDMGAHPQFNQTQNLFTYNVINGSHQNFTSGSTELTGSDILSLQLIASKSINVTTTSFSPSHSASITYMSRSTVFVSRSFSGSQYSLNGLPQAGIYFAPVSLSLHTDTELNSFVGGRNAIEFKALWKSVDDTITYAQQFINFSKVEGKFSNALHQNLIVNVTNLQEVYNKGEVARLRVFASDLNQDVPAFKVPVVLNSVVIPDMRWRVLDAYTRDIVIPFDEATKMSTDQDGMYFDFFFGDLDVNKVYEFEFLVKTGIGRDNTITNRGFRFKVVP